MLLVRRLHRDKREDWSPMRNKKRRKDPWNNCATSRAERKWMVFAARMDQKRPYFSSSPCKKTAKKITK
jgi:hypothetical protein